MMPELLEDVISRGGKALEAEDRQLRAFTQKWGRHGGLLGIEYERHYQLIVWKSLLGSYQTEIEFGYEGRLVDLMILWDGKPVLFEMKYWQDESTVKIYPDILQLQLINNGGYLLIFAANPKKYTDENLRLIGNLKGIGGPPVCYRFDTENTKGDTSYEFWFAGWPVPAAVGAVDR